MGIFWVEDNLGGERGGRSSQGESVSCIIGQYSVKLLAESGSLMVSW